jgi:hypothetical protein
MTFDFLFSSSSPFPPQLIMAPQTPPPGVIQSELSRNMGTSTNEPLAKTQQARRHQSVNHDAAIAATKNMPQDANLLKVCKS